MSDGEHHSFFSPELEPRREGLGVVFQEYAAQCATLPSVESATPHTAALLETIEFGSMASFVADADPDGYVYSLGAGVAFALPLLYKRLQDGSRIPRGFFTCDIKPEVVLTARIVPELIRQARGRGPVEFLRRIRHEGTFTSAADKIVAEELDGNVKQRLADVNAGQLHTRIARLPGPDKPFRLSVRTPILVLDAICEAWDIWEKLSSEQNIGAALASFYDPALIDFVTKRPRFTERRNVIYSANLIDYTVHPDISPMIGVWQPDEIRWQSFTAYMQPFNNPNNTFIFTSNQCDFALHAIQGLPSASPQSLWKPR